MKKTITDEELDRMWAIGKALEKKRAKEWAKRYNAMTEEEKKQLEEEFSDPFYERISENPLGDDDGTDDN